MANLDQRRKADAARKRRNRHHARGDHSECRPERCEVAAAGSATVTKISPGGRPGGLVASTRRRLEKAGRLDTPEGWQAVTLAEALEASTPSAMAALSRELRAVMKVALDDADTGGDRLDGIAGGFGSA